MKARSALEARFERLPKPPLDTSHSQARKPVPGVHWHPRESEQAGHEHSGPSAPCAAGLGRRAPAGWQPGSPAPDCGEGEGRGKRKCAVVNACKPEMGDALRRASPDANKMEADAAAAHNLAGGQPGEVEEEWTARQQQAVARHTRSAPHP